MLHLLYHAGRRAHTGRTAGRRTDAKTPTTWYQAGIEQCQECTLNADVAGPKRLHSGFTVHTARGTRYCRSVSRNFNSGPPNPNFFSSEVPTELSVFSLQSSVGFFTIRHHFHTLRSLYAHSRYCTLEVTHRSLFFSFNRYYYYYYCTFLLT